jgi:methylglutaconyl-CoA hydratase
MSGPLHPSQHPQHSPIGFLNRYIPPPATPLSEAIILARQIVTSAPLALGAAKQAIDAAADGLALEKGLDLERELYNPLLSTNDRQEGLKAFAEKRRAKFVGT